MIKIIDDALPEDMFNKCFDFLNPTNTEFDFHNENIPWTLGRDILTEEELNPKLKSTYQMHHMLFWDKGKSEHYDGCLSAIKSILPEFTEISLYRMKINALLNNSKVDAGITNIPHADLLEPHLSFVLYLNDSDGDTVFYKEKWDAIPLSQLTECKRVSPKKNRVVISDGNYHASQNPIDNEIRLILNAVIKMKEDNDKG
jgi:hypothetical protein